MDIEYKVNVPISTEQFINLLEASTLAERRPVEDKACIEGMIANSNLIVTAWINNCLIGIARSITDFHYACYLSDLAVDAGYQKMGVGRQLQSMTQQQLGPRCKIILIAAPAANAYYKHIGFSESNRCWLLERDRNI